MKIVLFVLVAFFAAAQAIEMLDLAEAEWGAFKLEYGKKYDSEVEDKLRMKIFMENKHKIAQHNREYASGNISYYLKINQYADMLHHEFAKTVNGFNITASKLSRLGRKSSGAHYIPAANVELPETVDWREHGAVTPVKDQGACGSCWAFAATGSLEGQHFRRHGVLVSLSEQNLVDCSGNYGNNGCGGGIMDQAFKYIRDNKGIDTEESYPYEARNLWCRFDPKNIGAEDTGFVDITEGDENMLKTAVATVGPISVGIDASHQSFQLYGGGVYNERYCSSTQLDHGVLVVGYGTDEFEGDYWLIKNSWGKVWGIDGYIKIARNKGNKCGVASSASYPLV